MNINQTQKLAEKLIKNLENVIIGKRHTLEQVVVCLLCQGHLLIEDVPGTGKTILARSLAKSIGGIFSRVQFTPDMLPSDIIGVSIYNQEKRKFEFRPGPIMAQIVLADEINRATPKTQSALLEAMEEKQITVDGESHKLRLPFMVIGTQNPIEYEGTFPLLEAQLDRFFMRVALGYPSILEEIKVLESQQIIHPIENLQNVLDIKNILAAQAVVKTIHVSQPIKRYIVDIVRATREHVDIYLGASPRGSIGLFKAGQAYAAMSGRDYVLPDDIKALVTPLLAHRMIVKPGAKLQEMSANIIIEEILSKIPVPTSVNN
jgi:MoxR-like ATPase